MASLRTRPTTFIVPRSPREQLPRIGRGPRKIPFRGLFQLDTPNFSFFISGGPCLVFPLAPSFSCSNLFQSRCQVVVPLRPFPPVEADSSSHFLNLVIWSVCDPRMPVGIPWGYLVVPTGWGRWGRSMGLGSFRYVALKELKRGSPSSCLQGPA